VPGKLLFVLVNTDPTSAAETGAPFFQATVAAAMDYPVEMVLTGRAAELAVEGVAEKIFVQEGSAKSLYAFIQEAVEAGVQLKVCTPTLHLYGHKLIPEITERVGAAYIISRAMDGDTITFTY
jgi:predicted peroxiredoxin